MRILAAILTTFALMLGTHCPAELSEVMNTMFGGEGEAGGKG
jgi:hypothetical protein